MIYVQIYVDNNFNLHILRACTLILCEEVVKMRYKSLVLAVQRTRGEVLPHCIYGIWRVSWWKVPYHQVDTLVKTGKEPHKSCVIFRELQWAPNPVFLVVHQQYVRIPA